MDLIRLPPRDATNGPLKPAPSKTSGHNHLLRASAKDSPAPDEEFHDAIKEIKAATASLHTLGPALQTSLSSSQNSFGTPAIFSPAQTDSWPLTAATTTPSTLHESISSSTFQFRESDYAYSDPVAGSRRGKRMYPCAPVSSARWSPADYQERFDFVVGELKRAVDDHADLCDRARFINYSLCMCGNSPATAAPSIIVWCERRTVGALREVFKRKSKERLYCGKNSRMYQMFKDNAPPRPPFDLVYYRTDAVPLNRRAAGGAVEAQGLGNGSLCGALVKYGSRTATLGLTLQIGGSLYGLTVGHLFDDPIGGISVAPGPSASDSKTVTSSGTDEWTLNDDDLVTLTALWNDDNDTSEDEEISRPSTPLSFESEPTQKLRKTRTTEFARVRAAWCTVGRQKQLPAVSDPTQPYLDYGLISLKLRSPGLAINRIKTPGADRPVPLGGRCEAPVAHVTPVYIVSGASGVREARLIKSFSYIGSNPGQKLCRAWTAILDDATGVIDGDCGSVVVDQQTLKVYGYVIGSSPLNHAYVVPLADAAEQIKENLGLGAVDLPEATTIVESLEDELDANETSEQPATTLPPDPPIPLSENGLHINRSLSRDTLSDYSSPTMGSISRDGSQVNAKFLGNPNLNHGLGLFNRLKEREQIFLIDDSASMHPYWSEVESVFGDLAKIIRTFGVQQLQLCFPASQELHSSKSIRSLKHKLRDLHVDPCSSENRPDHRLLNDFKRWYGEKVATYRDESPTGAGRSSQYLHRSGSSVSVASSSLVLEEATAEDLVSMNAHKPVSLYILSNGIWGPDSAVGSWITGLVEGFHRSGMTRDEIGIQFIHFGRAGKRMERKIREPDAWGGGPARYPLSFEPSTGSLWEMLVLSLCEHQNCESCASFINRLDSDRELQTLLSGPLQSRRWKHRLSVREALPTVAKRRCFERNRLTLRSRTAPAIQLARAPSSSTMSDWWGSQHTLELRCGMSMPIEGAAMQHSWTFQERMMPLGLA